MRTLPKAQRMYEATMTPLDKYREKVGEITRLWEMGEAFGGIDTETAQRAMAAAQDAFDKATMGKGIKPQSVGQGPAATTRGSKESWATIVYSIQAARGGQDDAAKTADNTAEAVALLRQIADKTEDEWEV